MITSGFLLACAMAKVAQPTFDYNFSTTCDSSYYWMEDSGFGLLGSLGPNPSALVHPVGFTRKENGSGMLRLTAEWSGTEPFEIYGCVSSEYWAVTLANNQIVSIDFSTDYRKTNPTRLPQLFLMQGSKTFIAEIPNTSTNLNQWISATKSLSCTDFVQVKPAGGQLGHRDTNSHPDFSTSGQSMYFMMGLDVVKTEAGDAGTEKLEYDNLTIKVHTVQNP
ncbi:MAG: hypothetical protein WCG75_02560 [Armatimonadota bacterium]